MMKFLKKWIFIIKKKLKFIKLYFLKKIKNIKTFDLILVIIIKYYLIKNSGFYLFLILLKKFLESFLLTFSNIFQIKHLKYNFL